MLVFGWFKTIKSESWLIYFILFHWVLWSVFCSAPHPSKKRGGRYTYYYEPSSIYSPVCDTNECCRAWCHLFPPPPFEFHKFGDIMLVNKIDIVHAESNFTNFTQSARYEISHHWTQVFKMKNWTSYLISIPVLEWNGFWWLKNG